MLANFFIVAEAAQETMTMGQFIVQTILPMAILFVVGYFLLIRPHKKREKEVQAMRSGIQVGDEVLTSGGIIGRVVSIKEDSVVIESGPDRSKMRIMRWAIQQNNTIHETEEDK